MRVFKTESAFDAENQEWAEIYYIDNQEVSQETYFEELELEPYGEDEVEQPCDCEDCQEPCECDQEFTDEELENIELVEEYAKAIEETQCECGCELRNILYGLICEARQIGYEDAQIDQSSGVTYNLTLNVDRLNGDKRDADRVFEEIRKRLEQLGKH